MLKQIAAIAEEELQYRLQVGQYNFFKTDKLRCKVLVNGSPKTGTTWMVNLLSSLPGHRAAGNFRGNLQRYRDVAPGAVMHGHEQYTNELREVLQSGRIKTLLMIRDPRDQTVSRMFHIRRDTTHRWHHRLNRMRQREALMACIEGGPDLTDAATLIQFTRTWLNKADSLYCVRYEDLVSESFNKFSNVLHHLGIDIPHILLHLIIRRNRFERLVIGRRIWKPSRTPGQENPTSHYRKGIIGDWKNHFDAEHVRRFKEVAGDGLIMLGYEQDHEWQSI